MQTNIELKKTKTKQKGRYTEKETKSRTAKPRVRNIGRRLYTQKFYTLSNQKFYNNKFTVSLHIFARGRQSVTNNPLR